MSYTHYQSFTTNNKYWGNPDVKLNGIVIHSIGVPQPKASVLVNNFNKPTYAASVHGIIEPGAFYETVNCFNKPGIAKKCYHVGSGSKGSYNTTRFGFEMTEPKTIKYTGGSCFTDSDPAATKAFISAVTQTAAEVCADICIYHNIPVSKIISHAGACKEGMGSNHGDPDHLWKYVGYTIEQFRKDVQAIIDVKTKQKEEPVVEAEKIVRNEQVVYRTYDSVPDWGKYIVKDLMDRGIINGTGETVNGKSAIDITEDLLRTLVILHRAGGFQVQSAC